MRAKIEITLFDGGGLEVKMDNPGSVDVYTVIGVLEKVKGELVLGTPEPSPTEAGE